MRLVLPPVFSRLPIEWYMAARYIRTNIRQSLIIMLAVGMGVAIIIFVPSINLSFFEYFLNKTVQNAPHINVTREMETGERNRQMMASLAPEGYDVLMTDQTVIRRRNIKAYQRLMKDLMKFPGVTNAAPFVQDNVIIVRGSASRAVDLRGIVPEAEKEITDIEENVTIGNLDTLGNNEIFLGYLLADELNANIGNRVTIVSPYGRKNYKLTGLIDSGNYLRDLGSAWLTLEAAQQVLDLPNEVTGIGLRVAEIYTADNIAKAISRAYPVKTRSWMEDNVTILEQISNFRTIIAFISFMIVMAAASSITSVLIMVVASKSKEIGILKAMGASPGSIMRLFVIQAVFLALLGSVAGIFGGWLFIQIYNFSPMSRSETLLGIGREPATLNIEYTFYAVFYAMASSILASIFPAWRASRLDPVQAINQ